MHETRELPPRSDRAPHHVCPWWVGHLLASPLRKLFEHPERILEPHVRPGMRVLDVGCAMGFFSLPLARMVGPDGRVVCVDLQARMIASLRKRLRRQGLSRRADLRVCEARGLGLADLEESIDFALAYHVIHETPDPRRFLREILATLRPGGRLLVAEPQGHVDAETFASELAVAGEVGFELLDRGRRRRSFTALLSRPA